MLDIYGRPAGVDRPPRRRSRPPAGFAKGRPPGPLELLTTGRVAALAGVSMRAAAVWVDRGELAGYALPGSNHRRVHAADLIAFMLGHGMFRALAECTVADGGILYRCRVHDRWGSPVARVAPPPAPDWAGLDWLPWEESRYVLKAATPEAFQILIDAGFVFEDGR
jgi:hypothetical protein